MGIIRQPQKLEKGFLFSVLIMVTSENFQLIILFGKESSLING